MPRFRYKSASFHRCRDNDDIWSALETWYQTELGSQLAIAEKSLLGNILSNLFGYHLVHLGYPGDSDILSESRVSHCARIQLDHSHEAMQQTDKQLCASPVALPFMPDSLDVVVLSHVLEFSSNPHAVLREVERCLIPDGHVVFLGFNPVSSWGMGSFLRGWRSQPPWCGHFMSASRVKDWLTLLGFEVCQQHYYFHQLPLQPRGLFRYAGWLEGVARRLWPFLGAGYALVAKKRTEVITPIRPRWKSRRRIVATGLVESMTQHEDR